MAVYKITLHLGSDYSVIIVPEMGAFGEEFNFRMGLNGIYKEEGEILVDTLQTTNFGPLQTLDYIENFILTMVLFVFYLL